MFIISHNNSHHHPSPFPILPFPSYNPSGFPASCFFPSNGASNLSNSAAHSTRNTVDSATDSIAYSADTLSKSLTDTADW